MAEAIIVIPPFVKVVCGPFLGPAMLVAAARAAGHTATVVDLNTQYIAARLNLAAFPPGPFVGDFDKPEELRGVQASFAADIARLLPASDGIPGTDSALALTYGHEDIRVAAERLVAEPGVGTMIETALQRAATNPSVVGVSVLYSGQVVWAVAVGIVARRLWPETVIVWGGPHVTALRRGMAADAAFSFAADRFVFGHAERTFVAILDAIDRRASMPTAAVAAGSGSSVLADEDAGIVPVFDGQRSAWLRYTLPAQTSRGCVYGRCSFCTYPSTEGAARLSPDAHVLGVIGLAMESNAAMVLKDSLVTPARLRHVAGLIGGRVQWGALTKIHSALAAGLARRLASAGCVTLEVGLETLSPAGQALFHKQQSPELFRRTLGNLADAGIAVIVNYMTGLPGVEAEDEAKWLHWVGGSAAEVGALARVEHNTFQLERMAPMGLKPEQYGIRVTRSWPWASVMAWDVRR